MLQTPLEKVTYLDVKAFLDERIREHAGLEYKELRYNQGDRFEFDAEFLETIVAFANSGGGLIICGVREERGTSRPAEVVGIRTVPKTSSRPRDPVTVLRDTCAAEIEPRLSLETAALPIPSGEEGEGTVLLLVRVRPGPLQPYFLRDHGIYIRQDESDRLATVREIEALIEQKRATPGRATVPWAQAQNDVFAYARSSQPGQHLYLMLWLTPAFPITPVPMDSTTDEQFQQLCERWFRTDQYVFSLADGIVYSPALSPEVGSEDRASSTYACAYEDGTVALRWLEAERSPEAKPTGHSYRIGVPALWHQLRRLLLEAQVWPRQTCQYSGPLRCRVGLADVTHTVVAELPTMRPQPTTAILNRQVGWQYQGEWHDAEDLEDFLAGAMASLARQLQCRWYGRFEQSIRTASQP